uniref:Uncharacterized protein n=1 Tax=Anguilla anguilla TaxID=7936 RepID=A0A0E9U4V1_ANGAN
MILFPMRKYSESACLFPRNLKSKLYKHAPHT